MAGTSFIRSPRTRAWLALALGLVGAALGAPSPASAHTGIAPMPAFGGPAARILPKTLYVGHGAVGNGRGCAQPGYTSVQAAVDAAAPGDTVWLCGEQFAEQVFVAKRLTLTGAPTSGLTAVGTTFATSLTRYPAGVTAAPKALLVTTADDVLVGGLRITGPFDSAACSPDLFGVLALKGSVDLRGVTIADIANANPARYNCQTGVAVVAGRQAWKASAQATISGATIAGYQKGGVFADGPGSRVDVSLSKITGGGAGTPWGTRIAQNGVQISRGATGSVVSTRISANRYSGIARWAAAAILVSGGRGLPLVTDVLVKGNLLTDNDIGVALQNTNADGTGAAETPTRNRVTGNWITNGAVTNVGGLCDGNSDCGGTPAGYQAAIQDIGNADSACANAISGAGYAEQGQYDASGSEPVFTQTGDAAAFVRAIDAGGIFPTTGFTKCGRRFGGWHWPRRPAPLFGWGYSQRSFR